MHHQLTRRAILGSASAAALVGLLPRRALAATDISYWHTFASQVEVSSFVETMKLFYKAHPDIHVAMETIPNKDFMQKISAAVVADSKPDTAMVAGSRFADMKAMGALTDLTDRIAKWNRAGDFSDTCWAGISADGHKYGIASFSFVNWMYYRKDWFDEAGISKPPDTYQEFLEAAMKITDPKKNRYGFGMRGGDGGHQYLIETIRAWGSPIVEDGKPAIDKAKAVEAVKFYAELFTKYKVCPPSAPNDSFQQIMAGFKTGQTGMIWHHTGSLTEIQKALPNGEFFTAIRPKGPAKRSVEVQYQYNSILNNRNEDASWDFLSFWGEPEAAISWLKLTGYFPASKVAAKDKFITDNPIYGAAAATLEFGVPSPQFAGYDGWGRTKAMPEFQKVLIGQSTPEQAVDNMMASLEQTLR